MRARRRSRERWWMEMRFGRSICKRVEVEGTGAGKGGDACVILGLSGGMRVMLLRRQGGLSWSRLSPRALARKMTVVRQRRRRLVEGLGGVGYG